MCVCIYIYIYSRMYIYTYKHTHTHDRSSVRWKLLQAVKTAKSRGIWRYDTNACMHVHKCMYACMHVFMCTSACLHVCIIHVHKCMHVYCIFSQCAGSRVDSNMVHVCMHNMYIYVYMYIKSTILSCACVAVSMHKSTQAWVHEESSSNDYSSKPHTFMCTVHAYKHIHTSESTEFWRQFMAHSFLIIGRNFDGFLLAVAEQDCVCGWSYYWLRKSGESGTRKRLIHKVCARYGIYCPLDISYPNHTHNVLLRSQTWFVIQISHTISYSNSLCRSGAGDDVPKKRAHGKKGRRG